MKYIQFFLSAMFFFFAALQFNDPDPVGWVLIYGFAGIASLLMAIGEKRPYFRYALLVGLMSSAVWMALWLPEFMQWINLGAPNILSSWKEGTAMTEMVREFLGLAICTTTFGYYMYQYASRTEKPVRRKNLSPEFSRS